MRLGASFDKDRKTVYLVFPVTGWDTEGVTVGLPLPLLLLAGPLLEQGYKVRILDQRLDRGWREELARETREGNVLAVGITAMTGLQILGGLEAAAVVRDADPSVPIVWGGVHPTLLGEQTASHPLVDAAVVGEGEDVLPALLDALLADESPGEVPGIAWRGDDGTVHLPTQLPKAVDLDALARPPYHLVDMRRYITTRTLGERDFLYMASRGCPHVCTYCYETSEFVNNGWRAPKPEKVVEELMWLRDTFGITAINFQDDLFFAKKRWVDELSTVLLDRKVDMTFRADCRVDYAAGMGLDFFQKVRSAGFKMLFVGVESGSDRILKFIRKYITRERVIEGMEVLREADIAPHCSFMAGFPTETMEEVHETIDLMQEVTRIHPNARCSSLQLFSPYPGTELWDWCVEHGLKSPESLEEWGRDDWNTADHIWLGDKDRRFLEKAGYFTFFLDGHTMNEWTRQHRAMNLMARAYTQVVRARVRRRFYAFMPELAVLKAVRRKQSVL